MFKRLSQKRAQSTLEYAVLIGMIVAGLIAMQAYLKRGFQGKMKESADSMGEQFSLDGSYNYTTNSFTNSTEDLTAQGATTTTIHDQQTNRTGNESTPTVNAETLWWR